MCLSSAFLEMVNSATFALPSICHMNAEICPVKTEVTALAEWQISLKIHYINTPRVT